MKIFESHFWYNKRQRNGILFLLGILIAVQAVFYFVDFSHEKILDDSEFTLIQQQLDSLKKTQKTTPEKKIYPFNPNYITDFKAYQIGLKPEEIDRLFTYRKEGKYVNSAEEFQLVTGVSDSLLQHIALHFKFPDWVQKKPVAEKMSSHVDTSKKIRDLNQATADELLTVPGLTRKIAQRIVAYRKLLGGYTFDTQLSEVYGIDSIAVSTILLDFKVLKKPHLQKVNINEVDFKTLLHTPYLNYELTKMIFRHKDRNGLFGSLEDLKKIDSFPLEKFDRIALYLTAE